MAKPVSISMPEEVLEEIDEWRETTTYQNKSRAYVALMKTGLEYHEKEGITFTLTVQQLAMVFAALLGLVIGVLAAVSVVAATFAVVGTLATTSLVYGGFRVHKHLTGDTRDTRSHAEV